MIEFIRFVFTLAGILLLLGVHIYWLRLDLRNLKQRVETIEEKIKRWS